jgi:hypothetical protein
VYVRKGPSVFPVSPVVPGSNTYLTPLRDVHKAELSRVNHEDPVLLNLEHASGAQLVSWSEDVFFEKREVPVNEFFSLGVVVQGGLVDGALVSGALAGHVSRFHVHGENAMGDRSEWRKGPTLAECLESLKIPSYDCPSGLANPVSTCVGVLWVFKDRHAARARARAEGLSESVQAARSRSSRRAAARPQSRDFSARAPAAARARVYVRGCI